MPHPFPYYGADRSEPEPAADEPQIFMDLFGELDGGGGNNDRLPGDLVNEQAGYKVGERLADADSGLNHRIAAMYISIRDIQRHILLAEPLCEADPGKPVIHPEDGIDQSGFDVLFQLPLL